MTGGTRAEAEPIAIRPVFIGGCDRSGTTMLGSMLGAARGAVCTPESSFPAELTRRVLGPGISRRELIDRLLAHPRFVWWEVAERPPEVWRDDEPASLDDLRRLLAWAVTAYARDQEGTSLPATGEAVWVDHSPHNLRDAKALIALYPEAKFIHIVRDGRAVAASILPLDWGPNTVRTAAWWWMGELAHAFAGEANVGAERVRRVRYEDVLRDPETELGSLCRFAGLECGREAVEGGRFRVPESEIFHRLVGRPPDPSRAEAWRAKLSPRQIAIFEGVAGDLLDLLGYAPMCAVYDRPRRTLAKRIAEALERIADPAVAAFRARINARRAAKRLRAPRER